MIMKLISWNVNGLRACCDKGFREIFNELDADFFCLQETKMQEGQLDLAFEGYTSYWNYAEKKGYSGTAIFTRHQPLSVTYGLGIDEHDHEGRVITLEMENFYLVTVYTPNSQDGFSRYSVVYREKSTTPKEDGKKISTTAQEIHTSAP
jgi:exodeoxyribonuclease III